MKTFIKNLGLAALAIIVLLTSGYAADGKEKNVTVLSKVKNINKVIANGNVEVILLQAPTESIRVYDNYYSKNALVQEEDGVLRITSYQKEKLIVAVYVRNLSAIEASGNAEVKTIGKMNFLSLDVTLKDNARATIDAQTINLYTAVSGNASLAISGSAVDYYAVLGSSAKLNMAQFTSETNTVDAFNPLVPQVVAKHVASLPVDDEVELSK